MEVPSILPWTILKTPRKWQSEALCIWTQSLRGIVRVVTGGGKTTFAQFCMNRFRSRYPSGRFVIIVPTLTLLDQWYVSLHEDMMVPEQDFSFFSGESRSKDWNVVNIMVLNSARTLAPKVAERFPTMLIVDECHRAASPANARSLEGQFVATLGISATPEREHDDHFRTVLVPALGSIIFRYDYDQALQDEIIVPFDLVNISVSMTTDEQHQYNSLSAQVTRAYHKFQAGLIDRDVFIRKLQQRARMASTSIQRIPVAIRIAEENRGNRIIVFHESVNAAESILRILSAKNFNATIYHSRINPGVRRDNLRLYRRGVFDVLITCRALDEGVNVPETNVAIVASSTASGRQRIQRLGRVLRPAPGKQRAKIFTIYTTSPEEERLVAEARELDGVGNIRWMRSTIGARDATSE